MIRRLLHGLAFGTGFAVAFVAVVTGVTWYMSGKSISFEAGSVKEFPEGEPQEIVPASKGSKREFSLYTHARSRMMIPEGGGIISVSIVDTPPTAKRPWTIQGWVTESNAYLIRTKDDLPTVVEVDYPPSKPEEFARQLVSDAAGFREENSTWTVSEQEISGLSSGADFSRSHLNGEMRITSAGVVFFLPNEIET